MTNPKNWTATHAGLIAALRDEHPEVQTGPLLPALCTAFPDFAIDPPHFPCVPDAWVIRADEQEVDIFEVEVTHPISRGNFMHLANLYFALDTHEITMRLYVVSRYGHINSLDVLPLYLEQLERRRDGECS